MKKEIKQNAKSLPEIYYCKHMLTGVCTYENEVVLVDADAMKRLNGSFAGKPIYIDHQDVNLETLEIDMDGVVSESFYNELDGCLWAKMIITTDAAKQKIKEGWSVSNAYFVSEWGSNGLHNNTEYNREVLNGEFSHLAIVENPRYEKAKIYTPEEFKEIQRIKRAELDELKNSKQTAVFKNKEGGKMFKLFKNTKEEVSEIDADTMIELENGKSISVQAMVDAVANAKKNEAEEKEKEEKINENTEVDVDGEKMPLKDLINKYSNMCKKNAEDEDKENEADPEEEKKNEEEEKENSKHFEDLRNAKDAEIFNSKPSFSGDQVSLGKSRYGSN